MCTCTTAHTGFFLFLVAVDDLDERLFDDGRHALRQRQRAAQVTLKLRLKVFFLDGN